MIFTVPKFLQNLPSIEMGKFVLFGICFIMHVDCGQLSPNARLDNDWCKLGLGPSFEPQRKCDVPFNFWVVYKYIISLPILVMSTHDLTA